MPTVLITGANRGLGLELARQYAADGWKVHAACRDPRSATGLDALARASGGKVLVHALDLRDPAQVQELGRKLAGESIDVLLNNAGIYPDRGGFGKVDYAAWEEAFRVNVMAPMRLIEALVEPVARSEKRLIVNMSSLMGSIGDNARGGSYVYRSSKAALNIVTKSLSIDLAPRGITAVVLHPGWVKTDMGGPEAPIEAEESVRGMRQVIARLEPGATGKFFDYEGDELPW